MEGQSKRDMYVAEMLFPKRRACLRGRGGDFPVLPSSHFLFNNVRTILERTKKFSVGSHYATPVQVHGVHSAHVAKVCGAPRIVAADCDVVSLVGPGHDSDAGDGIGDQGHGAGDYGPLVLFLESHGIVGRNFVNLSR